MQVITTHLNADFDAIASCMAAKKLYPDAHIVLPGSMSRRVKLFFDSFKPFEIKKIKEIATDKVKTLIVVDTRNLQRIGELAQLLQKAVKVHLYDHHPKGDDDIKADFEITEQIGALSSLFTEIFRKKNISISPIEATLLCLGIYEETGCLLFPSTTERDVLAVAYLLKRGANLNIVSQFLKEELSRKEISLLNELLNSLQEHLINGIRVHIAHGIIEEPEDVSHIAHKIMDVVDTDALFIIIEMADKILIIGRSNTPQVDVGSVLNTFGGGGHWAAASATLKEMPVTLLIEELLKNLKQQIKPQKIARDLMTTPVISVQWDKSIKEVEEMMTKYGINAIPVLKDDKYTGIITRGVVEKAIFHGLKSSKVGDFATTDAYTAEEDTPVMEIEKNMIELNQRFVPILKDEKVIGVITRTDILRNLHEELIRKFKIAQPKEQTEELRRNVTNLIKEYLPEEIYEILNIAGNLAQEKGYGAYLVGGSVRDLLMRLPSPDIDIVVEGDGILFAHDLSKRIGGKLTSHARFATAKIMKEIKKDGNIKTIHIDIATARTEYYESPAALPKVETSSIKKDLYRRDFTINALAVKLNTKDFGLLIDFFGGQRDIKDKKIRVLHNLSFVEDPTRAIRAIRFAEKLGFKISKHTENLIKLAVKMGIFEKLKGPRLYEELILLLQDTMPQNSIKRLKDYGLLKIIHPSLEEKPIYQNLARAYEILSGIDLLFLREKYRKEFIYLMVILKDLNMNERLELLDKIYVPANIKGKMLDNIQAAESALQRLTSEDSVEIYNILKPLNIETIILMMIYANESQRKSISLFLTKLKDIVPSITGENLKKLGIKPGPVYRKIFETILREKLRGRLLSKEEEIEFVKEYKKALTTH
ncbi:MAG TPA: CBS domain-containing protein [Thermodesulfovibrio thiophilus]|nr:CBS domain-containing protein [Thermodesulfovibrio thiophilus]